MIRVITGDTRSLDYGSCNPDPQPLKLGVSKREAGVRVLFGQRDLNQRVSEFEPPYTLHPKTYTLHPKPEGAKRGTSQATASLRVQGPI